MRYGRSIAVRYNKSLCDRFTTMRYDESFIMDMIDLLLRIMILSDSKPSTVNISMRNRRICFIFEALNSACFIA